MLVLSFSPMISVPASADPAANVTPAAGGGAISADTSAGAPGQAWTSLGPITISEGAPNDIDDGVFILTIPAGFEFNVASWPDVVITGATPELAANTPAATTATTISVTITDNSTTEADTLTIGGVTPIQVRPTAGTPLASGNINMTAGTIAGVTGTTNFGTLNEVAGAVATLTVEVQPSDALVGVAIAPPVQVKAVDQFTNIIPGQNIAVTLIAGTGTLSGTSPRATNASGIATFNDLSIDTAGPGKVLRFNAAGRTVDSNPFNILVVGITVNPTSGLVTTEAGGSDNFTAVLDTQPSDNVTIALSSNDLSEGTVSPASLTFTTTDWNTPQTVTVTGVDDFIIDGNIAYNIVTTPATSTDPNYNGFNASDVAVTNTDDDVAIADAGEPAAPPPVPPAVPRASPTPPHTLKPAQLSVRYLSVNPQQAYARQPVTITTNVVNTGDEAGSYNVVLKINGQVEQTKMISVGPQGTQPVKFTITKAQPGTYTVNIDDQKRSFIVTSAGSKPNAETGKGILFAAVTAAIVVLAGLLIAAARRRPRGY